MDKGADRELRRGPQMAYDGRRLRSLDEARRRARTECSAELTLDVNDPESSSWIPRVGEGLNPTGRQRSA